MGAFLIDLLCLLNQLWVYNLCERSPVKNTFIDRIVPVTLKSLPLNANTRRCWKPCLDSCGVVLLIPWSSLILPPSFNTWVVFLRAYLHHGCYGTWYQCASLDYDSPNTLSSGCTTRYLRQWRVLALSPVKILRSRRLTHLLFLIAMLGTMYLTFLVDSDTFDFFLHPSLQKTLSD